MPGNMETCESRAALDGMEERLFKQVSKGATPAQWAVWLRPALEHAVAEGDLQLFRALLKAGADPSAGWKGCDGRTLLDAAAEGGNEEIMSVLLKKGNRADLNVVSGANKMPALYRAIAGGHTAAARALMMVGARVDLLDKDGRNALHHAAARGDRWLVEDVLIARAPVGAQDIFGNTPLHLAAARGYCDIVSALLRAGADLGASNERGLHALHVAVHEDGIRAAEALLKEGADPNFCFGTSRQWSPLRFARRSSTMTRLLLKYGAKVDTRDAEGYTPLFRAAATGGSTGVIDALIAAGAEVDANIRTPIALKGRTPLHKAAASLNVRGMDALLRHGAGIHLTDDSGLTPLHMVCISASKKNSLQAADFLLRRGADEMRVDNNGLTPKDFIEGEEGPARSLRRLLARAPVDRAWRRRALLVLYRAFPDRLQRGDTEGEVTKMLCQGEGIRADAVADRGEEDKHVVVRVVEVEAEGIFRKIVGFL